MVQRDFIDQRTAMQEPLLHPSDTIYHAPSLSLPPSLSMFFHRTGIQFSPSCKREKSPKKKLAHSRANDWGLNSKPVTFQQDITNGHGPRLQI